MTSISGFLDDNANPIVIKEIHQGMRSRYFLIFMMGLLLVALVLATLGAGVWFADDLAEGVAGERMFAIFFSCLSVVVLAVVPLMSFRSIVTERDGNTLDILAISGLSPVRLATGKFAAAMLHVLLFFALMTPFLAMSYMLRGIDVVQMLRLSLWLLINAAEATLTALCLGAMAKSDSRNVFLHLAIILLALWWVGMGIWVASAGVVTSLFFPMVGGRGSADIAPGFVAMLLTGAAWIFMLLGVATSLLTFESANRSTWPRSGFLLFIVLSMIAGGLESDTMPSDFLWIAICLSQSFWVYLAGMFATTETHPMSRRVKLAMPTVGWAQPRVGILWPGPGRGWLFMMLVCTITGGLPTVIMTVNGSEWWYVPMLITTGIFAMLSLTVAIVRAIGGPLMKRSNFRHAVFWTDFGLCVILMCGGGFVMIPMAMLAADDPEAVIGVFGLTIVLLALVGLAANTDVIVDDLNEQRRARREHLRELRLAGDRQSDNL